MRWELEPWRKLYRREEGSFALLPLVTRSFAAELLKFVDDEGRLFVGNREPWEAIARVCGATTGDRRLLRQHIPLLIKDGYLVHEGDYIRIRNMGSAQGRPRKRGEREPDASPTRPENEADATGERTANDSARVENEPRTKTDPSARNDSESPLAGAGASEERREDSIRREETQNTHTAGAHEDQGPWPPPDTAPHPPAGETWIDLARRLAPANRFAADVLAQLESGAKLSPTPDQRAALVRIDDQHRGSPAAPKPLPDGVAWTARRWTGARAAARLAEGDPAPRHCTELWDLAEQAATTAAAKGRPWSPSAREIVAFWFREYLSGEPPRAGGQVLEHYPLPMLVAKVRDGFAVPTTMAQVRGLSPESAPPTPRSPRQPEPPPAPPPPAVRALVAGPPPAKPTEPSAVGARS